tara:strand:+ start:199 stop:819 length:621 start_codon:yes stop_codon:yes gene_type:complete
MLKNSILLLPLFSLTAFTAIADSNIVSQMSHIGFGYKHAHLKKGAFEPYSDSKYINDESKTYGGLYLDLGLSVTDSIFLEGNADFVTRFSSSIDSWQAGAGFNAPISPVASIPLSCGVINYYADTDKTSPHSEQAAYCKGGLRAQVAKHWMVDATYQHDFFTISKDTYRINNVFQFGSVFGFTLGMEYAKRLEPETAVTVGLQFTL